MEYSIYMRDDGKFEVEIGAGVNAVDFEVSRRDMERLGADMVASANDMGRDGAWLEIELVGQRVEMSRSDLYRLGTDLIDHARHTLLSDYEYTHGEE